MLCYSSSNCCCVAVCLLCIKTRENEHISVSQKTFFEVWPKIRNTKIYLLFEFLTVKQMSQKSQAFTELFYHNFIRNLMFKYLIYKLLR